ncbi:hypothetical protein [Salipiger thiooxidans]|uniref:hypothetical protein n=1 Tax=Salipiger thiooxidans TaxID=282683 RepID=UPI001CD2024B|nr:hypothetical protein [Salipiger thiooxidans]MCA0846124.1 hypothetical protein [Salipiger thiooxidans]
MEDLSYALPASLVGTLIILGVIGLGRKFTRQELSTGAKGPSNLFLAIIWSLGLALFMLRETSMFMMALFYVMIGALMAFGFAIIAVAAWSSLLRALRL